MRQDSNVLNKYSLFFLEEESNSAALAEEEVARRVQRDSPSKLIINVLVAINSTELNYKCLVTKMAHFHDNGLLKVKGCKFIDGSPSGLKRMENGHRLHVVALSRN